MELQDNFTEFFDDLLTYQIGNHVFDTLRIEFPSIIELLQEGLMIEPKYRNTTIYECTIYKGFDAKKDFWDKRQVRLTYQHRMHPHISKFIRDSFYEGEQVKDPDGENGTYKIEDYRKFNFATGLHNIIEDVKGREEKPKTSFINEKEVERIYERYCEFENWAKEHPKPKNNPKDDQIWKVAIITFYKGQVNKLSSQFQKHFSPKPGRRYWVDQNKNISVRIFSVDSVQGQEADVVFVSFVRTRSIGFLDNLNRINVALSRAKYYQIVFCNVDFFKDEKGRNKVPPVLINMVKKYRTDVEHK